LIEELREKNRNLETERLPLVIHEKKILAQDIEARAKEQLETNKAMEEMTSTIRQVTESLRTHAQNTSAGRR
jgi:methyl-accepting chemotaxis protein